MDVHEVHYGLGEEMRREDRGGDGSKALDVSVLETVTQRLTFENYKMNEVDIPARSATRPGLGLVSVGTCSVFRRLPAFLSPTNCEISKQI